MKHKKQKDNERRFKTWVDSKDGERIYTKRISGRIGWYAEYIKRVDSEENTLDFTQKIYNEKNKLVEIHQKYPQDKGHKKL